MVGASVMDVVCQQCGVRFDARASEVRRGMGKFCSRACMGRSTRMTLDEFMARVEKRESGCWEWTGVIIPDGYGQVGCRHKKTHRVAYELMVGPIPDGLCVLHRCDNPPCVNPDHLFLGTVADNNADRDAKGRHRALQGSANGSAKLDERRVCEIREMLRNGVRGVDIAREFGVSPSAVSLIATGRRWDHLFAEAQQ